MFWRTIRLSNHRLQLPFKIKKTVDIRIFLECVAGDETSGFTDPVGVVVDADEGRNDSEVVNEWVEINPGPQQIRWCHQLHHRQKTQS